MNKNFNQEIVSEKISDDDLALINTFAVKPLTKEEVFTFNVILCDNEIDRDIERFDIAALEKLKKLFIGKSSIFDHDLKSKHQTARIYDVELYVDNKKTTSFGEKYAYLKAKAYMPITDKNKDLITEINAGIKKEVSINCSIEKKLCSICKKDIRHSPCEHQKGIKYANSICHHILSNPTDAYEWSFVAVPAQRQAGITKSFNERTERKMTLENIFTVFKSCENSITLSKAQADDIIDVIHHLEKKAKDGEEYRSTLKNDIIRLSCCAMPSISAQSLEAICKSVSIEELKQIRSDFEKTAGEFDSTPQLSKKSEQSSNKNNDFII